MKLKNRLEKLRLRLQMGDLVLIEGLDETGIVVEPTYVTSEGSTRVGVMLSDTENIVIKADAQRCHLISRSIGSPCHATPFPDELLIEKGPKLEKFSSERFQELSTLTIDEDDN